MLEILDLIHYFEKYGPWGLLIGLFIALRRNRKLKRYINRHLPGILRSNGDSDLVEIKKNQELIMQHLGVVSCADSLNPTTPCLVEKSETWFTSRWQGFITARSAKKFTNLNTRRKQKMREYLRKLGSRKFQALLISLAVNIVSAVLFVTGTVDMDSVINQWMPIINMTIGTISTWVYIWVEGGNDKANIQKGGEAVDYRNSDDIGA